MSMHKKPLTPLEEKGLRMHGLPIGEPSQLADVFRLGMLWANATRQQAAQPEQCKAGGACRWRGTASAELVAAHALATPPTEPALPPPDEWACVGGVSQPIYTADTLRAALSQPQAAQPEAVAYRSTLITAFCAKWSGNDRPEAGDVLEWLMAQPLATPPTEPQAPKGN